MRLECVMISCTSRRAERAKTLRQLGAVGVVPHVIEMECEPASIAQNRWGAYHAALRAYNRGADLLFLEDDIDVNPKSFGYLLQLAYSSRQVVSFCVMRESLHSATTEAYASAQMQTYGSVEPIVNLLDEERSRQRRGFHGSQCLLIPHHVTDLIVNEYKSDFVQVDGSPLGSAEHGFDFWLKDHWDEIGGIYEAFPNPVNHRVVRSTFSGKPNKCVSKSFDLPVRIPADSEFANLENAGQKSAG